MYEPRRYYLDAQRLRAIRDGDKPDYDDIEAMCNMSFDLLAIRDELEQLLADYAPYVAQVPPQGPPDASNDIDPDDTPTKIG